MIAGAVVLNNIAVVVHDVFMEVQTGGTADYGVVVGADTPSRKRPAGKYYRDRVVEWRGPGAERWWENLERSFSPVDSRCHRRR